MECVGCDEKIRLKRPVLDELGCYEFCSRKCRDNWLEVDWE